MMRQIGSDDVDAHVDDLGAESDAVTARTELRGMTAFDTLVLQTCPDLVRRAASAELIRAWVVGCSTGIDAYLLAISLLEARDAVQADTPIKIFATDVDPGAIATARDGVYPARDLAELSDERVSRWFVGGGDAERRQVVPELRAAITFAPHDALADPPFSRLDVICCRNLLPQLQPAVQRHLLERCHFGLKPGRYLLLGESEGVGAGRDLFAPVREQRDVFHRLDGASSYTGASPRPSRTDINLSDPAARIRKALLDEYAPPAVLVDRDGRILSALGDVGAYLDFPTDPAQRTLPELTRRGLGVKVRKAVEQAIASGARVVARAVRLRRGGPRVTCMIDVQPLAEPAGPPSAFLVAFCEEQSEGLPDGDGRAVSGSGLHAREIALLESEVRAARNELYVTAMESEGREREWKACADVALSNNQELRVMNEELASALDNLQSQNRNLEAESAGLREDIDGLVRANDDWAAFMEGAGIAAVLLDRSLRVRRFTPAATSMNLRVTDIGRPLEELSWRADDVSLLADCRLVLEDGAPRATEFEGDAGERYWRRVLPSRAADGSCDGVVITLRDITEDRRILTDALQTQLIDQLVAQTPTGAARMRDGRLVINAATELIVGYSRAELPTVDAWFTTLFGRFAGEMREQYDALRADSALTPSRMFEIVRKNGERRLVEHFVLRTSPSEVWVLVDRTQRAAAEDGVTRLRRRLADSRVREAQEIARSLHDDIGGEFSGVAMSARALALALAETGSPLAARAEELADGLQRGQEKLRTLARGITPVEDLPGGLTAALSRLASLPEDRSGTTCTFSCEGRVDVPDQVKATHLFRIAQEAVHNALKHAKPSRIAVTLKARDGHLHLSVSDDGDGLDPPTLQHADGVGIHNMRERARILGGELRIDSGPGRGSTILCVVPEE